MRCLLQLHWGPGRSPIRVSLLWVLGSVHSTELPGVAALKEWVKQLWVKPSSGKLIPSGGSERGLRERGPGKQEQPPLSSLRDPLLSAATPFSAVRKQDR